MKYSVLAVTVMLFFFFLRNKEKIAEHNVVSSFVVLAFECCHVSLGT